MKFKKTKSLMVFKGYVLTSIILRTPTIKTFSLLCLVFSLFTNTGLAQTPANNDCNVAEVIPTIPATGICVNATTSVFNSSPTLVTGTNSNATVSIPTQYLAGCRQGEVKDVWYRIDVDLNTTLLEIELTSSTIQNPSFAIYRGTSCGDLSGLGCVNGSNGAALDTFSVTSGSTVYIQVAGGNDLDQGSFELTLNPGKECSPCAQGVDLTIYTLPNASGGRYAPGTTVEFCIYVNGWDVTASDTRGFIGVELANIGGGWNLSTLGEAAVPDGLPIPCETFSSVLGTIYNHYWYLDTDGFVWNNSIPATNYGPGYYFESGRPMLGSFDSLGSQNPADNFGEQIGQFSGQCSAADLLNKTWKFCFQMDTKSCNSILDNSLYFEVNTLSDGEAGVNFTSNNKCSNDALLSFNSSVEIDSPTITSSPVTCPGYCDGTATVSTNGMGYNYLWDDPLFQSTATATGLCAGDYSVIIFDAGGCIDTLEVSVSSQFQISQIVGNNPSSFGATDGTANVITSGGVGPLLYIWSDGQNNSTATNLSNGCYYVTVTDANSCSDIDSICLEDKLIIEGPDFVCDGESATICGTLGYANYIWSTGETSNCIVVNASSTYTLTADSLGTAVSTNFVFTVNPPITAIGNTITNCNGMISGSDLITVSGGTPPFNYFWQDGIVSSTPYRANLADGLYEITATDSFGCTAVATGSISNDNISANPINSVISAIGTMDGSVSVNVTGNYPPYNYLWDNGGTTQTITGLAEGCYNVTVTSSNNCPTISSACVLPPFAITGDSIICPSGSTMICGSEGFSNYLWSTGENFRCISVNSAGTYSLSASLSGTAYIDSKILTINPVLNVDAFVLNDVSCNGNNDGGAFVTYSGGTSPYSSFWSTGSSRDTITNLFAGYIYSVTVSDANYCTASDIVAINEPSLLTTQTFNGTESALGANDGTVSLIANGGTGIYTYLWSNGLATSNVTGLSAGCYDVTVTDSNGCEAINAACVSLPMTALSIYSYGDFVTCNQCVGEIHLLGYGGNPPYSFYWQDGETITDRTNLCPGSYSVTITDNSGATISETFDVSATAGCVWPGDENNDQLVNMYDILSVGLAYGETGQARTNPSIIWNGYFAQDWSSNHSNGTTDIDNKHADSDGNGIINEDDTLAVSLNYDSIYVRSGGANGNIPITVKGLGTYNSGEMLQLPIYLGDALTPAQNVYGVAFSIIYDTSKVVEGTVDIDFTNSWLEPSGSNLLTFSKNFRNHGRIDVALVRTDHMNVSGSGRIASLHMTIIDDVFRRNLDLTSLDIVNTRLLDADGYIISVDEQEFIFDINTTSKNINILEQSIKAYPNPANSNLIVEFDKLAVQEISIYSISGQLLESVNGLELSSRKVIPIDKLTNGVYLLKIRTSEGELLKRITILH